MFSSFRGGASGLKSCGTSGPADHPNGTCEAASPPRICVAERRARPVRRGRGVPTLSRKRDVSRPERKPTRAFGTSILPHIFPPDSALCPHVARSAGRSSPALIGGFVDPEGRPVGGAHKMPVAPTDGENQIRAPSSTSEAVKPSEVGVRSVTLRVVTLARRRQL
jgi:hypothetical protein